jgi:catechol 2,3-dioxygenase-like lactoylglutathione lyase family enzyme
MFSHVTLGADDLEAAGRFYDALLTPLGLVRRQVKPDGGSAALCWRQPDARAPWFFVFQPYDKRAASVGNGTMAAFLAPSPEAVREAYAAAIAAGGRCEGPPGERPRYAPGYYGAYLRDPQGNKVHVVHRGDWERD